MWSGVGGECAESFARHLNSALKVQMNYRVRTISVYEQSCSRITKITIGTLLARCDANEKIASLKLIIGFYI